MIIKTSYPFMKPPPSARLIRGHRLAQGLIGGLPFNENGGLQVFDSSRNNNNGTLVNSPTWTDGKYGSAIDFPGTNEYVDFGDNIALELATGTISILVKWDNTDAVVYLYWKETSAANKGGLDIEVNGVLGFRIKKDNTWRFEITTNIVVGVWYHIVAVFGSSGAELFINGVSVGTDANTSGFDHLTGGNVLLPARMLANLFPSNCQIDNVMIYNRALSVGEVAELYREPFGMFERRARTALMSGYEVVAPPVGMAGAMTTNTGYWGW